jgi:tetratricopeptide (TPR) repeat protein
MEDMRAALASKGYDLVGTAEDSDSDDDPMPGRIRSIEPDVAREKGKTAFERGKYDKAIKYWQGGLKSILSALCAGPEAMSNTSLSELDLTLNLNIAMAYMKKGDFESADRSVDKALARRDALPPHQITKALYRKASAQKSMNRLAETLETLKDLLEVDPTNAAGLKMQQEVQREWTRQTKAQNANFKKMFSKMAGEDQKEKERLRRERAEARETSGIRWTSEDVDPEAFERGDTPVCDGRDWGLALSRSTLWCMEQFAVEASIFMPAQSKHLSAWFLGSSSTCELRWLQPNAFMSRLPSVSTLELVLIGFLGEYDPDNKRIPDPIGDKLPKAVLKHRVADDPSRNVYAKRRHANAYGGRGML